MTIEEVKEKRSEMDRKISAAMKEFEQATQLQIDSDSNEFGIEEDYSYNIETYIKL